MPKSKKVRPQEHPLWKDFVAYCYDTGVTPEGEDAYEEDWKPWWEFFLAGATAVWNTGKENA